jgi:DNA recombination protein RmuC
VCYAYGMVSYVLGMFLFMGGVALGAAGAWWLGRQRLADAQAAQASLSQHAELLVKLAEDKLATHSSAVKESAQAELGAKHGLIDQRLSVLNEQMTQKMAAVTTLVTELEKDRTTKFVALESKLTQLGTTTQGLHGSTQALVNALSNSRVRGQWGERMAEDVLRLAGLQENIQYRKQGSLSGLEGGTARPDYTFLLPDARVLHMDVKFPLDNYLALLNAADDPARASAHKAFVADVKNRLKETTLRGYAKLAGPGEVALDYVLVFIPNEQVYAYMMEHAPEVLEDALRQKLILCSPTTLLAVLAVIRQSADHFRVQAQAAGIHKLLGDIKHQWGLFDAEMTKMGSKIDDAQKAFQALSGTRTNMLDRQFAKLDDLPALPEN